MCQCTLAVPVPAPVLGLCVVWSIWSGPTLLGSSSLLAVVPICVPQLPFPSRSTLSTLPYLVCSSPPQVPVQVPATTPARLSLRSHLRFSSFIISPSPHPPSHTFTPPHPPLSSLLDLLCRALSLSFLSLIITGIIVWKLALFFLQQPRSFFLFDSWLCPTHARLKR